MQSQGLSGDATDHDLSLGLGQPEDGSDQGRLARPCPPDYADLHHEQFIAVTEYYSMTMSTNSNHLFYTILDVRSSS